MGAWGHKAYDNDTGEEWLDGFSDILKFLLTQAFWSRWQEEGVAAARVLCDLPHVLQGRIGPHPFAEALEVIDAELKPEQLKPWKSPAKRARYLRVLKLELEEFHGQLMKSEAERRKRISKMVIVRAKASTGRVKSKPRGTTRPSRSAAKPTSRQPKSKKGL